MRKLASHLFPVSLLLASASVAAQPHDSAAAEALFEEAKRLAEDGRYAEACPKFAESNRLDPGVGVLMYLGACYEREGRVASAWAAFREAREGAGLQGRADRQAIAKERTDALEPRLPRLRIVVPPDASISGLEVFRDDVRLGDAMWGTPIPVDPGTYAVTARAPGYQPWEVKVEAKEGQISSLEIPPLELLRGAPAPTPAPSAKPLRGDASPAPAGTGSTQRTAAIVVWGVGGASLVAGAVFGLVASSQWSDAQEHCEEGSSPLRCTSEGMDGIDATETSGLLSTIFFATGGAAAAAGAVLWLTAPNESSAGPAGSGSAGLSSIGPSSVGLAVDARGMRAFGKF